MGAGEPVLLIHGGIVADAFLPLLGVASLADRRLIRYRRRAYSAGYGGAFPVGVADDARDALALLDALGIAAAHLVGHSHGGIVAIEVAHVAPQRVLSLGLLEAGLSAETPSIERAGPAFGPTLEAYAEGRVDVAIDLLSRLIFGENHAAIVQGALGADPERDARDARATFESDLPAQGGWRFADAAPGIHHPVLSVLGGASDEGYLRTLGVPLIAEVRELLSAQLPQTQHVVVEGVNHLLQIAEPEAIGAELARFYRSLERA